MEDSTINVNDIIKIETLPKIMEKLELLGEFVDKELEGLDELECTEDNKQLVKNKRTCINNTLKTLEDKRKEIKNNILKPYEYFNKKYEETTKLKLENASKILGEKISKIELEQKEKKEKELRDFYTEYSIKYNLQSMNIPFESIGLNITISASMKSLKDQIISFVERISNDLKLISVEEYADEIRIEYNRTLDFAKSKLDVVKRHEELKKLQDIKKAEEILEQKTKEITSEVESALNEEITAPKEIVETLNEEIDFEEPLEVTFTVWAYKDQIIELKRQLQTMVIEQKICKFK